MFYGNSGTSSYNAAEGKFNEVDSTMDPDTGETGVPFDFGSEAAFLAKVDLSVAGNMMDCGECHVGGGAMEYIPNNDLTKRTPLADLATTGVVGFPDANGVKAAGVAQPITAANYTAFNYFIDTYDVDGDGDKNEAQYIDFADAGVMEMDCFMCHLPGYEYEARRDVLRKGKLGALASIGAGIASENAAAYGDPSFGTTVVYNDNVEVVVDSHSGESGLGLSADFMSNLSGIPDSTNCASCHANEFSVDWKKRGDHWAPNDQVDFQYEVHYSLGCMGCHERDAADDGVVNWLGVADPTSPYYHPERYTAQGVGSLGHDPAKGMYAQYSGLYNKNDDAQFKDCVDCHINGTEGQAYGAPNPTAAHQAAGLTAVVAQGANTMDGVAKVSHIDMMHCSTCHSRKAESYDWGNTGAPMIDATGDDHDGRLTDHENVYVTKPDMTDQTSFQWYKGKLRQVQPSATMFWRDKQDTPLLDANFDGRPHGMDALLMTDVLAVNQAQDLDLTDGIDDSWGSITEDNHGVVTQADFAERITALANYIEAKASTVTGADKTGTAKIKFSVFHVNFANQHGVSPASMAWGAKGCGECHSPSSNFFNGYVDTVQADMTYGPSTSQRVPFTKVNGFSQPTDWHPNQFDKFGARSIAIQVTNVAADCNGDGTVGDCLTTRPVQKSETMYENTFMGAADYAASYTSSGPIDFSGFEKGWQLIVQVNDGTERLKMVSTDITDIAGLIANLGTNMTDGTFGFTITGVDTDSDGIDDGITVAGTGTNLIRLKAGNAASFKLTHAAYKNTPWTGVDGNTYNGRADWVSYLNSINGSVLPDAGQAVIAMANPSTVEVGQDILLDADESVNADAGEVTYSWICNDLADTEYAGSDVTKSFTSAGTYTCNLRVVDSFGTLAQASVDINVTAPAPAADIAITNPQPAGTTNTVTFSNLPTHTMLYIIWGDGTREKVYDAAASVDVDHLFRMYSKYFDGTNYNYRTTVYVYNGSSRVDIKREILSIAAP